MGEHQRQGTLASPGPISLALVVLLLASIVAGFRHKGTVDIQTGTVDFLQFYTAGLLAGRGEAHGLYDQAYFLEVQAVELGHDNLSYSIYPPILAVLMIPLAQLPYQTAVITWWALQAVCLLLTGWIFYQMLPSTPWRVPALLALATLFPLWIAISIAHMTPLLLLALTAGLRLHERGRRVAGGCVLSALAIKPQFAAALVLWMLLRRDWRTLAGLAAGVALQTMVVAVILGPRVLGDYVAALPAIADLLRERIYPPLYQQSLAGITERLLLSHGVDGRTCAIAMLLVHTAGAGAAGVILFLAVRARQKASAADDTLRVLQRYEYACMVVFLLLFPTYLLVYDHALLAVPIVCLWSTPSWRLGVVLYLSATLLEAAVNLWIGAGLTGMVAFIVVCAVCAAQAREGRRWALAQERDR